MLTDEFNKNVAFFDANSLLAHFSPTPRNILWVYLQNKKIGY